MRTEMGVQPHHPSSARTHVVLAVSQLLVLVTICASADIWRSTKMSEQRSAVSKIDRGRGASRDRGRGASRDGDDAAATRTDRPRARARASKQFRVERFRNSRRVEARQRPSRPQVPGAPRPGDVHRGHRLHSARRGLAVARSVPGRGPALARRRLRVLLPRGDSADGWSRRRRGCDVIAATPGLRRGRGDAAATTLIVCPPPLEERQATSRDEQRFPRGGLDRRPPTR